MPVIYDYIDSILESNGLRNPVLDVLIPDHQRYSTMVYQHKGNLIARTEPQNKFIGNADDTLATAKHLALFESAFKKKTQLLLTPEYSCPIVALKTLITSDYFPAENNLWVVGCESIRPDQLREFKQTLSSADVAIIAEEAALANQEDKILDPICYLFQTASVDNGKPKRVALFQFKTFPMGATGVEAENLLFGTKRFVFRNNDNSIYLATILCSESLIIDLEIELKQFVDKPYLLLHPQMNKGARTDAFKSYRTEFYTTCMEDEDKELICLNWAKDSTIAGTPLGYSNSAFYTKAKKINLEDTRVAQNDRLGMYYNCWSNARSSILVFGDEEAIYHFENFKTSKRTLAVQNQGRYGPEMLSRSIWDGHWLESEIPIDQSFSDTCTEIGGDFSKLLSNDLTSINKERLLSLSTGVINSKHWFSPDSSTFFKIDNTEQSFRLLVYQDPETQAAKRRWLAQYASLSSGYLLQAGLVPADSHLQDLGNKPTIHYSPPDFHYNVTSLSAIPACIVYAGDSDPIAISQLKANLLGSASSDNGYRLRLMILYTHLGQLCKDYEKAGPDISGNSNGNPIAINKRK